MAYSLLSSIKHGVGGAIINNTNGKIISDGNYTFHTCMHPVSGLTMIQIFGVHDPLNPVFKSQIVVEPGTSNVRANKYDNLFLLDNILFVNCEVSGTATPGGALVIVDVRDKLNPFIIAQYTRAQFNALDRPTCVIAKGNYAYVTTWNTSRLLVFDISNLSAIVQVASVATSPNVNPFAIRFYLDNYLTLTNNSAPSWFQVWNITNPLAPVIQGAVQVPYSQINYTHGHIVLNNRRIGIVISIYNTSHAVTPINLNNPSAPVWLTGLVGGSWPFGLVDTRGGNIVLTTDTIGTIAYGYEAGANGRVARAFELSVTNVFSYRPSTFDIQATNPNGGTVDIAMSNRNFLTYLTSNEIILAGENVTPPYPEWVYYLWDFAIFGYTPARKPSLISMFGYASFDEKDEREVYDFDYVKNLFCAQDRKKVTFKDLCSAMTDVAADTLPFLSELLNIRNIERSTGSALDTNGALVNQLRNGLQDKEYRDMIYFKIFLLYSSGAPDEVIAFFKSVAKPESMNYIEEYPAKIRIEYVSAVTPPSYLYSMVKKLVAGGVGLRIVWSLTDDPMLECSEYNYVLPDSKNLGLGEVGNLSIGGKIIEFIV